MRCHQGKKRGAVGANRTASVVDEQQVASAPTELADWLTSVVTPVSGKNGQAVFRSQTGQPCRVNSLHQQALSFKFRSAIRVAGGSWQANPGVLPASNGFGLVDFTTPLGHRRQEIVWAPVAAGVDDMQPIRLAPRLPLQTDCLLQMSDAAVGAASATGTQTVKLVPAEAAWQLWQGWSRQVELAAQLSWTGALWQDNLGGVLQPAENGQLFLQEDQSIGEWKISQGRLEVQMPGLRSWHSYQYDPVLQSFSGPKGSLRRQQ